MKRITVESGLSKNYLSSLNKLKINGNARNVYIAIRGRIEYSLKQYHEKKSNYVEHNKETNEHDVYCFITREEIAELAGGIHPNTVSNCIKKLQQIGLIEVVEVRRMGKNAGWAYKYYLCEPFNVTGDKINVSKRKREQSSIKQKMKDYYSQFPTILSHAEMAEYLGVSVSTARRYYKQLIDEGFFNEHLKYMDVPYAASRKFD